MRDGTMGMNEATLIGSLTMPTLPVDLFSDLPGQNQNSQTNRGGNNSRTNQQSVNSRRSPASWSSNNTFLDDDMPVSPVQESSTVTADNPEYFRGTQPVNTNSQTRPEYQPPPPARGPASQASPGEYPVYDLEIPSYDPLLD